MRQGIYNSLLSAIVATSISTSALAQNGLQTIEEITVTSNSRQSEGLAEINAAVSVLTQDELSGIAHTHAQEALNRLPGVSFYMLIGSFSVRVFICRVLCCD